MRVEACCQALLTHLLPKIDPDRHGICIDVGVGTFAFYCQNFAQLGFQAIAVEPLPVPKLKAICQRHKITLIEACLSNSNEPQTIYMGRFAGLFNQNFNSLSPDWFGSSTQSKQVPSLDLNQLIQRLNAPTITCLKLDIEGWEPVVISQLKQLDSDQLPRVVMFEYGGGSRRDQKSDGWAEQYINGTLDCLTVLKDCGYDFSVMIDYDPAATASVFDLRSHPLTVDQLFSKNAIYGNILAFRNSTLSEADVQAICKPYCGGFLNRILTSVLLD